MSSVATAVEIAPPSSLREAWRGYAASRGAVAALAVLTLIAAAALGASWLAPHDPI